MYEFNIILVDVIKGEIKKINKKLFFYYIRYLPNIFNLFIYLYIIIIKNYKLIN